MDKENTHSCLVCKKNGNCSIQEEKKSPDIKQCQSQRIDFSKCIDENTEVEVIRFRDIISNVISKKEVCKLKDSLDIIRKDIIELKETNDRDYSVILRNDNFNQKHSIGYIILYSLCTVDNKVRTSYIKEKEEIEYLKKIINYDEEIIIL